jgi:integrase
VTVDGRRVERGEGPFRRKADAEEWLAGQLQLQREGRPVVPGKVTVGDLLDDWLASCQPRVSPNTWEEYERHARLRLRPHLGHHRVTELRPGHIAVMLNELRHPEANLHRGMKGRRLSETTLQHVHDTLNAALAYGVRQRMLAHNPAGDVDRPRRTDTEMQVWTADELASFLATIEGERLHPVFHLAAFTGARRSELLGLQWPDVDLRGATVSVRRARVRADGEMVTRSRTKSARGTRVVDIDPTTVAVLRRWKRAQKAERLAWGAGYQPGGAVFTAPDGPALHADRVADRFIALVAQRDDLPRIRFHDLRHTHASLLLAAGVPPVDVAARIGDSLATLMSTYAHVIPRRGHQAAAAFAELLGQ